MLIFDCRTTICLGVLVNSLTLGNITPPRPEYGQHNSTKATDERKDFIIYLHKRLQYLSRP